MLFAGFAAILARASNAALPPRAARLPRRVRRVVGGAPPQAARVMLVFTLAEQKPRRRARFRRAMSVAAQTRRRARPPNPPSYRRENSRSLSRARSLAALYNVDTARRTGGTTTRRCSRQGFTLFEVADVVEARAFSRAPDTVFKRPAGDAQGGSSSTNVLALDHARSREDHAPKRWEYWFRHFNRVAAARGRHRRPADHAIQQAVPCARKVGRQAAALGALWTTHLTGSGRSSSNPLRAMGRRAEAHLHAGCRRRSGSAWTCGARRTCAPKRIAIVGRLGSNDHRALRALSAERRCAGRRFTWGATEAFGRPGAKVRIYRSTFTGARAVADGPISFEYLSRARRGSRYDCQRHHARLRRPPLSSTQRRRATPVRWRPEPSFAPADWRPFTIGRTSAHFLRAAARRPDTVFGKAAKFRGRHVLPGHVESRRGSLRLWGGGFSVLADHAAPARRPLLMISKRRVLQPTVTPAAARSLQRTFQPQSPSLPLRGSAAGCTIWDSTCRCRGGLVSLFRGRAAEPRRRAHRTTARRSCWEYAFSTSASRALGGNSARRTRP
jgi:hypothetical protein